MPIVRIRDIDTYYESHGEGEPLVLISGYSADHTSWAHILPVFSKKYRTIVFDNRGVGQTVIPDSPFTRDDMKLIIRLLLALKHTTIRLTKKHVVTV